MQNPSLYQINTRVVLGEISAAKKKKATLDDLPDAMLDDIAAKGFAWVWLLGVWQTGAAARQVSRSNPSLRAGFAEELPDLRDDDIVGSPFAVVAWDVHQDFGGNEALDGVRKRLAKRGIKLLLDFVPNHVAPDHPWVDEHPEYFVPGSEADLAREPQNYARVQTKRGPRILAYGRDPYFAGWPDTVQLNYRHAGFREAQVAQLARIADRCDGVRCDMAMLVQPEIFERTWGERARPTDGSPPRDSPFWPEAIGTIRRRKRDFMFVAEVYWDLEWDLQQAGFDFTYDKRLYDRLHARNAPAVHDHLRADEDFQRRSLRFLENHDEPRAAAAFEETQARAAAVITYLVPGLRFFHEGQFEGRKVHVSMHLGRRPVEPVSPSVKAFYDQLLPILRRPEVHEGHWQLWDCRSAWDGNGTNAQIIAMTWDDDGRRLLVVSNYGATQAQGYVALGLPALEGRRVQLVDLLSDAKYERPGDELSSSGLYLDLPPWGHHVFDMKGA